MKNQVDAMRNFSEEDGVAHFINSSLNKSAIDQVKSEPDFQKTMDPWIGEAWNELSYRQMLEQAVAENDFKLAIRIRYGGLLHLMDEKGMIRWDAHKTNRSYYYELKDKALRDDFEKLAYIFDCVCYGDFEVSASLYGQLEPVFDEFRDKLKK